MNDNFFKLSKGTEMLQERNYRNPSENDLKLRKEYKDIDAHYILADIIEDTFMAKGYERQGVSFYKSNPEYIRIIRPLHIHFVEKINLYYIIAQFGLLDIACYNLNGVQVPQYPELCYFDTQNFHPTKDKLKELFSIHKSARHVGLGTKTVKRIAHKEWYLQNEEWLNYEGKELIENAEKLLPFPDRLTVSPEQ